MFWMRKIIAMKIWSIICMSSNGGCDRQVQGFRGSGFLIVMIGSWLLATHRKLLTSSQKQEASSPLAKP